jgi:hypothetical protein
MVSTHCIACNKCDNMLLVAHAATGEVLMKISYAQGGQRYHTAQTTLQVSPLELLCLHPLFLYMGMLLLCLYRCNRRMRCIVVQIMMIETPVKSTIRIRSSSAESSSTVSTDDHHCEGKFVLVLYENVCAPHYDDCWLGTLPFMVQ